MLAGCVGVTLTASAIPVLVTINASPDVGNTLRYQNGTFSMSPVGGTPTAGATILPKANFSYKSATDSFYRHGLLSGSWSINGGAGYATDYSPIMGTHFNVTGSGAYMKWSDEALISSGGLMQSGNLLFDTFTYQNTGGSLPFIASGGGVPSWGASGPTRYYYSAQGNGGLSAEYIPNWTSVTYPGTFTDFVNLLSYGNKVNVSIAINQTGASGSYPLNQVPPATYQTIANWNAGAGRYDVIVGYDFKFPGNSDTIGWNYSGITLQMDNNNITTPDAGSSLALLGTALGGLAFLARRKR